MGRERVLRKLSIGTGCVAAFVLVLAACTTTPGGPAPVTTTTLPPSGAHTAYTWDCQAAGIQQVDIDGGITVDAPATVGQGQDFTIDYVIDQITIPSSGGGVGISAVGGWTFTFTMPTNATFVGASVSGGQGYSGTASVAESGGQIVFSISGEAPANGTVDYPVISVTMNASGTPGSVIETSVGGTSYGDPGLSFVSAIVGIGPVSTVCFPYAPAPIFSSTTIDAGPIQVGVCYNINGVQSFNYLGPANALANSLHYTDSSDCSTTPVDNSMTSVLSGQADEPTALATCQGLMPAGVVANVSLLEPITPPFNSADYWGCVG